MQLLSTHLHTAWVFPADPCPLMYSILLLITPISSCSPEICLLLLCCLPFSSICFSRRIFLHACCPCYRSPSPSLCLSVCLISLSLSLSLFLSPLFIPLGPVPPPATGRAIFVARLLLMSRSSLAVGASPWRVGARRSRSGAVGSRTEPLGSAESPRSSRRAVLVNKSILARCGAAAAASWRLRRSPQRRTPATSGTRRSIRPRVAVQSTENDPSCAAPAFDRPGDGIVGLTVSTSGRQLDLWLPR